MKKILGILFCGIIFIGLTGCGNDKVNVENNSKENVNSEEKDTSNVKEDNQELVDILNNTVEELKEEADENGYFSLALYKITDRLKEKEIDQYTVAALCDKEFEEKPIITGYTSENWTSDAKNIENYNGTCTYDTWQFSDYNKTGEDYNILVLDTNSNNYYNVTISFEKIKFNDETKYYPIFSNSKLLK